MIRVSALTRLLILDQPTDGLNPTQVQHMREQIHSLAQRGPGHRYILGSVKRAILPK